MTSFSYTVPVEIAPEHLWMLVRDVRRIAQIFPYTVIDDFESPTPDCWTFRRQINIRDIVQLCWYERAWTTAVGELHFASTGGDFTDMVGRWVVTPEGDGAMLTLAIDYAVPETFQPGMPRPLVDYALKELFKSICTEVKQAAEEGRA